MSLAVLATTVPVSANDGLFGLLRRGRQCNTKAHVQNFAVADVPDVYVIQNNTPFPLVAQGSTGYVANTYANNVLPLFDPNVYFQQELALIRAADQTAAVRAQRTSSLVERVVALQAPAVERLAAGDAAAKILQAAGLADIRNVAGSTNSVVIKTTPGGQLVVEPVRIGTPSAPGGVGTSKAQQAPPGGFALAKKYCAACHGQGLQDPKGGFYIGPGKDVARVLRAEWFSVTNKVSAGTMPPQGSPQPTDEERARILNEIESLILEGE
tara:strand:+ start:386 stop:1189 length:804 start_codon:yes stop_codon:yes gene_type:complete